MRLDIDIVRMIGPDGKAVCYGVPKVYWTIDESDTITTEQMKTLSNRVQMEVQDCLDAVNRHEDCTDTKGLVH